MTDSNSNQRDITFKEMLASHSNAGKAIFALALTAATAVALLVTVGFVLLFFPVSDIEVEGNSRYSYSDIIDVSGIKIGNRLYYVNGKSAEKKILQAFPYISEVKVHSYYPNRVVIEINEYEDIYMISHKKGFAYVNGEFEILEISDSAPTYANFSGIYIKLADDASGEVGEIVSGDDCEIAKEIIKYLKNNGTYCELNIIDAEDKYGISFVMSKKKKIVIGAMTDVGEKIDLAFLICVSDSFKQEESCVINASNKKNVFLRYVTDEIIQDEFDFCKN